MAKPDTFIIAEAGVNHNGCLQQAFELVDIAVDAKVDAIKFQTFCAKKLVTHAAPKADYQLKTTHSNNSQLAMLTSLELSLSEQKQLFHYCQQKHLAFMSTPFDLESANFLIEELKLPIIKVASGDITFGPLLLALARSGCTIILSSGMATLGEIEHALALIGFGLQHKQGYPTQEQLNSILSNDATWSLLKNKVSVLHCTSAYPTPAADVNLAVMDTLRQAFALNIGLSDHTLSTTIPIAAVARGACIIEKHFTIDRKLPGPDHQASLEPEELNFMVAGIREINLAIGKPYKHATGTEMMNKPCGRRSIILKQAIKQGEILTEEHLDCMRPGDGKSPMNYWEYLGKPATRDYGIGELL